MIVKATVTSIFANYNHLIVFITVTNETDDVFMVEARNQLKLSKELLSSLITILVKAFDGNYAFLPVLRELSFVDHTKSTISNLSFNTEVLGCKVDLLEWYKKIF